MDWTDRHYRFMMRLITKSTLLYTEMLVDQTVRTITLLFCTAMELASLSLC